MLAGVSGRLKFTLDAGAAMDSADVNFIADAAALRWQPRLALPAQRRRADWRALDGRFMMVVNKSTGPVGSRDVWSWASVPRFTIRCIVIIRPRLESLAAAPVLTTGLTSAELIKYAAIPFSR